MGFFQPNWMSKNKEVALQAVQIETDHSMLTRIAAEARLEQVRFLAARKILMIGIKKSKKYQDFTAFYHDNKVVVFEVTWTYHAVIIRYLKNSDIPFYISDLQQQAWVLNPKIYTNTTDVVYSYRLSDDIVDKSFFVVSSDERDWTSDEQYAIWQLVGEFMEQQSDFFKLGVTNAWNGSIFRCKPPATAIQSKRPY